ncbi:hypothetical protein vseg_015296 [Gypsophila vaccaria]
MFARRESIIIAACVISVVVVLLLLLLLLLLLCLIIRLRFRPNRVAVTHPPQPTLTPQLDPKRRLNYPPFFHRGSLTKRRFNWADHPTLINDVVENGWSRFGFIHYNPSWSVRSSLFNSLRVASEHTNNQVEEAWEVGLESVDFMQKLRFKINNSTLVTTARMNLPLPGPQVGNAFPKEAYFEITLASYEGINGNSGGALKGGPSRDLEKAKLLSQQSDSSLMASGIKKKSVSVVKGCGKKMVVGLSVDAMTMNKLPGSYPGSIGFCSNGSVYLAGMKLIFESDKEDWAQTGKVIGCGFDPIQKKVFFTLDSELIHVVHCKSEDFGTPMYPVIASNIDTIVLINLGQSKFSYTPANVHRTPNPCFTGPVRRSSPDALLEYEDSKELFSMGRLDFEWHSATVRSTTSNNSHRNNYQSNNNNTAEYDNESEAELFEIVLDSFND